MKFEKVYTIEKWTLWSSFLKQSFDDFYHLFSFYPNILEANNHTFSQIDFLTNVVPGEKEKLRRINNVTGEITVPEPNEKISLTAFQTEANDLDFAVDENLLDRELRLVYDSEPDWGDEASFNVPIEKNEFVKVN
jgi:hypothetical protein